MQQEVRVVFFKFLFFLNSLIQLQIYMYSFLVIFTAPLQQLMYKSIYVHSPLHPLLSVFFHLSHTPVCTANIRSFSYSQEGQKILEERMSVQQSAQSDVNKWLRLHGAAKRIQCSHDVATVVSAINKGMCSEQHKVNNTIIRHRPTLPQMRFRHYLLEG